MARLFLQTLYSYRRQGKFELHAFVLMPEHFHLLLTPSEITLERALQFIKGGYSHAVKESLRNPMEIWERGFTDHRIRDAEISDIIGCTFIRIQSKENWLRRRRSFVIARHFRGSAWTHGPPRLNSLRKNSNSSRFLGRARLQPCRKHRIPAAKQPAEKLGFEQVFGKGTISAVP